MYVKFNEKTSCWEVFAGDDKTVVPNWKPDQVAFKKNYEGHYNGIYYNVKKKEEKMLNDEENAMILEKLREDYLLGQSIVNDLIMSIAERGSELKKHLDEQEKMFDLIKKLDPNCDKCDCECDD